MANAWIGAIIYGGAHHLDCLTATQLLRVVATLVAIRVRSLGSRARVAPCTAYASGSRTEVGQKLVSGIGLILRIFSTFTCLTRDSTLVSPCTRWGMVGNFLVLGSVSEWKHAGMKLLKLLSQWLENCWGSTSGSCGRPLKQMLPQGQSQRLLQCRQRGSRTGHTFAALTVCGAQRLWLMGTFVLALSSESTDLTSASSGLDVRGPGSPDVYVYGYDSKSALAWATWACMRSCCDLFAHVSLGVLWYFMVTRWKPKTHQHVMSLRELEGTTKDSAPV